MTKLITQAMDPLGGTSPKVPAESPTSWVVAAAARRELSGPATTAQPTTQIVASQALASANMATAAAQFAPAAPRPAPANLPELVHLYLYAPIHAALEHWINTAAGQRFAAVVNTVLRSYAIGDGSDGTSAADPNGTAAGWIFGDGGRGWTSTAAGVAGGKGGSAGIFGDGGAGGAGAAGGSGGAGGRFMGIGGTGGDGGVAVADGAGGAGGHGGNAPGVFFGVGGTGGDGHDGGVGGAGGDGGNATGLLGNGGRGGDGGNGDQTGHLPALGGAGGQTAPGFGSHGAVGSAGTQAGITLTPPAGTTIPGGSVLPLGTTGTWLTDVNGNAVILHGTNQVDINPPLSTPEEAGFGDDDAAFLAANGFNVVRVGVDWSRLQPHPGVYDDAYLASIQQTVQTLSDHGIVTLLDMHQNVGPDWATGGPLPPSKLPFPISLFFDPAQNHALDMFWKNQDASNGVGLQNNYAQMMQHLAGYFNGNPGVLGIEIMNEPLPGNQTLPSIFGSGYFEGQQLTPFYNQVAAAIRSVNTTATIFYEPSFLATAMVPIRLGTVNDSNSVFSFHNYAYVNLGPLGVLPFVRTIENNAAKYARAHGIPAFMTEFGSSINQSSINRTVTPADHDLIGWTEWSYSNTGFGGIDGTPEWLVNDPSQPLVGDNVNTATLATLSKPYPQLVAGTPGGFSFDKGTFQFSYSTERVDGLGQFAAGSQTVIAVPAVQYPNGYRVTVTGGHVVSAPNASQLVIASDGGANTVVVTVSAALTA
ncbi:cellulase family glycosylhydrolase [Mycobacterium sp. BMJ-28]